MLSGLLASLAGWYLAERAYGLVRWEAGIVAGDVAQTPADDPPLALVRATRERAVTRNGALAMGVLGAVYGLLLGVAGGWSRESRRSALVAGTTGLLLGLVAGGAMPFVAFPFFFHPPGRPPDPMLPLLIQVAVYGSLSGAAGLAFGLGQSGGRGAFRGFSAAWMGSLLAVMLYNLLHTLLLPLDWDFSPLPVSPLERLAAFLCVGLIAGSCLAAVLGVPGEAAADLADPTPEGERDGREAT